MKRVAALLAIISCSAAPAEPPTLTIPPEVRPAGGYVRVNPMTTAKAVAYIGLSGVHPFPSEELKDARRFLLPVAGIAPGRYKFVAVGTLNDELAQAEFVVVVPNQDGSDPSPAPQPTPTPTPTPKPPVPVPPAPAKELRAILVWERNAALPAAQQTALLSPAVAEYLDAHCVKTPTGKPEWRRWDQDTKFTDLAPPKLVELFNAAKPQFGQLPVLVVGSDGRADIYPVTTEAQLLADLKKHGGE